jgi:uncharacterized repeat protein (TIGR01451 family)/fibro-slime domain-containing protein
MKERRVQLCSAVLGAMSLFLGLGIVTRPVQADTLSASWFSMATSDSDHGVNQGTGKLASTLGPNGFPVLNAAGQSVLHDFDPVTKELTWWNPAKNSNVAVLSNPVYPSTITLPFTDNNMFTNTTVLGANGDNSSAFLTAFFQGQFTLASPENVTFSVCSDDDEFVYLDSVLVVDNGGIHSTACASPVIASVTAGTHTLTVFYADRQFTQATFSLSANLNLTPVSTSDLGITKTDGVTTAVPGTTTTYTIMVSNSGPSAVTGALVTDTLPAALTGATWTCVASAGSSCAASGTGNIATTVNLLTISGSGRVIDRRSHVFLARPSRELGRLEHPGWSVVRGLGAPRRLGRRDSTDVATPNKLR